MQEKKTKMTNENNNEKKSNRLKVKDNPFINTEVYPVVQNTGYEFMDTYIREAYNQYNEWYLPGCISKKAIHEQLNEFFKTLSGALDITYSFFNHIEDSSLINLKAFYDSAKEITKDYIKEGDTKSIISGKCKNVYIGGIVGLVDKTFEEVIDAFNNESSNKISIFKEYSEPVFIKPDGFIAMTQDSVLCDNDIKYIRKHYADTFNKIKETKGIEPEYLMIVLTRLSVIIKNLPFGLIYVDQEASERNNKLTAGYYNSLQVREILDENDGYFYYGDEDE